MINKNKHQQSGFTLVEMVVTAAIIGILASIAIPQYQSYVARANRADAKTALLRLAAAQERFYVQNNAYAINPAQLNIPTTNNNYYDLVIVPANNNQTYVATATANNTGRQFEVDKTCRTFNINQTGNRSAENDSGADKTGICW